MKAWILCLAAVVMFAVSSHASAAFLGLSKTNPDFFGDFLTVTYDATSDAFFAQGGLINLQPEVGPSVLVSNGVFTMNLTVDDSGNASGGTLTLNGTIPSEGFNSGTLLTGTLAGGQFGFNPNGGDAFEAIFTVTGGDAQAIWDVEAGVLLDANFPSADFDGTFDSSFDNTGSGSFGNGVSDTFSIPEPASAALLVGMGMVVLGGRARRR